MNLAKKKLIKTRKTVSKIKTKNLYDSTNKPVNTHNTAVWVRSCHGVPKINTVPIPVTPVLETPRCHTLELLPEYLHNLFHNFNNYQIKNN